MTHEKKIDYMKIATGVCGFGFTHDGLDLLVSLYELIIRKEGKSDIMDMSIIEEEVKKRADIKKRKELLDKVSTKKK